MNHQPLRSMFGAGISGLGAIGNLFIQAHPYLSLLCICVSLLAGIYAIRVSRITIKHRELQRQNDAIEVARNQYDLCDACLGGRIPAHCPIPQSDRPADCPLNPQAYCDDGDD